MTRIILPIAIIAAILFAPIYSFTTSDPVAGDARSDRTGQYFVGDTVTCFLKRDFSISGDCEPKNGNLGLSIFAAVAVSALAAGLGVIGLLPFVGRITSLVTTLAGIVAIGGIAFFCFNIMGKEGVEIGWGSYLAGGAGLLTLISGLSGMRGN